MAYVESQYHKQLMESYYAAREAQLLRAESWALGYATEEQLFFSEIETRVTFKQWLINSRRES